MSNRDQIGTNAADSAPGVNDGPATGRAPRPLDHPRGRGAVFLWLALSIVVLLVIFVARPLGRGEGPSAVDPGAPAQGASPAANSGP